MAVGSIVNIPTVPLVFYYLSQYGEVLGNTKVQNNIRFFEIFFQFLFRTMCEPTFLLFEQFGFIYSLKGPHAFHFYLGQAKVARK